ncbi:hypothetical protein [Brevundimonas sp.]
MRWPLMLGLVVAAIGIAVVVWYASGGRFLFFFLPLLIGLPLLGRTRR